MSGATLLGLRTFPRIAQALLHSTRSNITSMRMGRYMPPSRHTEYVQKRTVASEAEVSARKTGAKKRKRPPSLLLRTLDSQELSSEDFVVLSGRASVTLKPRSQLLYSSAHYFPDDTQGFFYWHTEPGAPALAGQVRFRVTNSKDPASFQGGQDLRLLGGDPWRVSLFSVASCTRYKVLRSVLLSDGLVTSDLLDSALRVISSATHGSRHPVSESNTIWRFGQAIRVSLEPTCFSFWVVDDSGGALVRLRYLFRPNHSKTPSYKGTALVQFERSTLEGHSNTRTVLLRIVKILEITKLDVDSSAPEPKEGGLVMMRRRGVCGGYWFPWSMNIDRWRETDKTRAFKMLFGRETLEVSSNTDV
ncbi:hypothetical protein NEOLEDRAFT_1179298 [Neolentinus lepideus HHB14362 ss-1]|uniref:Uncharacterized protein n=1 Tax=Neolentinus lepideus HHB14362 ss-1 TaxID=1314782 RepID=A0A165RUW5_9AGAM|nr:hypothetical protein NEOLEDRAFT_1179298 [Neolentinus lepideus HHB14362 ss-1]